MDSLFQGNVSRAPILPLPASIIAAEQREQRDMLKGLGTCRSDCGEVDDYVLMGGFERGSVVGISAEDETQIGLALGLQTLIHSLQHGFAHSAMIITPKPQGVILNALKGTFQALAKTTLDSRGHVLKTLGEVLDKVMLSCVFDLDGVREALVDLEKPITREGSQLVSTAQTAQTALLSDKDNISGELPIKEAIELEIQDSQDDEDESEGEAKTSGQKKPRLQAEVEEELQSTTQQRPGPDMILITHFSSLLTSLYAQREKSAAHESLRILGSHLRHLCQKLPSKPLIILLNTTIRSQAPSAAAPGEPQGGFAGATSKRVADSTLRSVFSPAPLPLTGYNYDQGLQMTKPSFGSIFAQLLDMHLLCTRIPRTRVDADALSDMAAAAASSTSRYQQDTEEQPAQGAKKLAREENWRKRYVTVVEVLLDEMGVWEGRLGRRRHREQRWTVVDFKGRKLVDGVERKAEKLYGEVRLAAGFGGRRL